MKRSRVKRFSHRRAPKVGGEFCVIQERFRSGSGRTWFTTEAEAFEEASAILTGDKGLSRLRGARAAGGGAGSRRRAGQDCDPATLAGAALRGGGRQL